MAHTSPDGHHGLVLIGLVLGLAFSISVVQASDERKLAAALPSPLWTACMGLAVVGAGWLTASVTPRFAAGLATAAVPGAVYAAMRLAWDGEEKLAYGWSAIPVALGCVAVGAGIHATQHSRKPWSARRGRSSRIPRVRTR